MTIVLSVLMCLAVLFAVYAAYSAFAGFCTEKLLSYEEWTDRFFSHAGRLLDEENLPEEWLDTLSQLNSAIDDRNSAAALGHVYRDKNDSKRSEQPSTVKLPEEVSAFIEKHPHLARNYISATRSAFLALTFLAPIKLGDTIRADMAEDWERQRSRGGADSAIKEIEAVKKATHLKLVHSAA
jgi:hypothetical protein